MNAIFRIARAAMAAALTLPLGLPTVASANPLGAIAHPSSWHSTPQTGHGDGPKDVLARLSAQRARTAAATTGHFNFPYGLAVDRFGDLFVASERANTVVEVNRSLNVFANFASNIASPISVAVDDDDNVFAGSVFGGVYKYQSNGTLVQKITANTAYPFSIAVDQFDDLYVTSLTNVAIDDPNGNSLFSILYSTGSQVFSIAIGGATDYALTNSQIAWGSGSVALRTGVLQGNPYANFIPGLPTQEPVGSACAANGVCWFDDTVSQTVTLIHTLGGGSTTYPLQYTPTGIAYDPLTNHLYVADPFHNAIQVYNASNLAFQKTLT